MRAIGTVRAGPEPLLTDLDELHRTAAAAYERIADVILLLNYALMQSEPVGQIVFAVSAVQS